MSYTIPSYEYKGFTVWDDPIYGDIYTRRIGDDNVRNTHYEKSIDDIQAWIDWQGTEQPEEVNNTPLSIAPKRKKPVKKSWQQVKTEGRLMKLIKLFHNETKDWDLTNEAMHTRYESRLKAYNAQWIAYCNNYTRVVDNGFKPDAHAFYNTLIKPNIRKREITS